MKTPETRKRILNAIRKGASRSKAAQVARISPQTLSNWVAEDPDLSAELDQAAAEVTCRLLDRLMLLAEAGDIQALKWLLEMREPTLFGSGGRGFDDLPPPVPVKRQVEDTEELCRKMTENLRLQGLLEHGEAVPVPAHPL